MGVVATKAVLSRRAAGRRRIERLVRQRENAAPEAVARRSRITRATRAGRTAVRAQADAERRIVAALGDLLAEELTIREAAERVGITYHRARQLLRRPAAE